ncbi:MAG: radical SAM protein [Candidatus Omnitrophota bacterium]
MKVILIRPPFPEQNMAIPAEPLGLAYLASYLKKNLQDADLAIIDANTLNLSIEEILAQIRDVDAVGISYLTVQADFAYSLSKKIRDKFPKVAIIHGGVHPTCVWQETMDFCDYCVLGEGEVTLSELLRCLRDKTDAREVEGICFKKNGKIVNTPRREFISDINTIPHPAWDLLDIDRYKNHSIHVMAGQAVGIMASRGCPFNCSFCASALLWKNRVRFRDPQDIIFEIEQIVNNYRIDKFHFYDDNFLLKKDFVFSLCEEILKKKLQIFWVCLGRISLIESYPDLLDIMYKAGCRGIELGIESYDDEVLEKIRKKESTEHIPRVFNLLKEKNISPLMLLMTFNPGETITGWYYQALKLRQINPGAATFLGQFATPYPGTEFDNTCARDGLKLVTEWKDYSTSQINFLPFSLLKDSPKKTTERLQPKFLLRIIYTSLNHNFYWKKASLFKRLEGAVVWANFVIFFYQKCGQGPSIEQIAGLMGEEFNLDLRLSLKATSFLTVLMAQLGLIRSGGSERQVSPYEEVFSKFRVFKYFFNLIAIILYSLSVISHNAVRRETLESRDLIISLFGK